MKTALALLIGLPLLLASCDDNKIEPACGGTCAVITGRFLTDGGQHGIANVPLKLDWWQRSYIIGGAVHHKATATTDADGNYALRFHVSDEEVQKIGTYEISYQLSSNDFIPDDSNRGFRISTNEIKPDTVIVSNWLLPHKAYLHYETTNPSQIPAGENFAFQYSYNHGAFTGQGQFNYGLQLSTLAGNPTFGDVVIAANQPVELAVFKHNNNAQTVQRDTIQLAPGAHYTRYITY